MDKPAQKYKAGAISATVWENEGTARDGSPAHYKTISLQRAYKDKDGTWKHNTSFRVADLPKAIVVLSKAYEHLVMNSEEAAL